MPNNTGLTSAIIAIVLTLLQVSGIQLSDAVKLDVQNIIAEVIVLGSLAWTAYRHIHDKKTVVTLSNQVVSQGLTPQAGPAKDTVPTQASMVAAQSAVRKESRNA